MHDGRAPHPPASDREDRASPHPSTGSANYLVLGVLIGGGWYVLEREVEPEPERRQGQPTVGRLGLINLLSSSPQSRGCSRRQTGAGSRSPGGMTAASHAAFMARAYRASPGLDRVYRARSRFDRRRRQRRRRVRLVVAVVVLALLAPAVYSYTTTMMQPSSLPLWPRSVEWLRAHHGNWLVDEVEHYYYSWKAPKKGGPQLTSLPSVGLPAAPAAKKTARRPRGESGRRRSSLCSRIRCPVKACGRAPARSFVGARRCS